MEHGNQRGPGRPTELGRRQATSKSCKFSDVKYRRSQIEYALEAMLMISLECFIGEELQNHIKPCVMKIWSGQVENVIAEGPQNPPGEEAIRQTGISSKTGP